MWYHIIKGNKGIKITNYAVNCCNSFKEFENSGKIIPIKDNPSNIREHYSTVTNSLSQIIKTITVRL